jgi:hypothetical protein
MDIQSRGDKMQKLSEHIKEALPAADSDHQAARAIIMLMAENMSLQADQLQEYSGYLLLMQQTIIDKNREIARLMQIKAQYIADGK